MTAISVPYCDVVLRCVAAAAVAAEYMNRPAIYFYRKTARRRHTDGNDDDSKSWRGNINIKCKQLPASDWEEGLFLLYAQILCARESTTESTQRRRVPKEEPLGEVERRGTQR